MMELAYLIMASEAPEERVRLYCEACRAPYDFTEARVMRNAKNPGAAASKETPRLCWVCARLHLSARTAEPALDRFF